MSGDVNAVSAPRITYETCQAWARAIIAVRGMPPYIPVTPDVGTMSDAEEAALVSEYALISDFCEHWKDKL